MGNTSKMISDSEIGVKSVWLVAIVMTLLCTLVTQGAKAAKYVRCRWIR